MIKVAKDGMNKGVCCQVLTLVVPLNAYCIVIIKREYCRYL
jgi:hypothetical protein